MGLLSFIKDAGEKLFGKAEAKAAPAGSGGAPSADTMAHANEAAAAAIATYIGAMGLKVDGLTVGYDGASATVTVAGQTADQATKEKVLLCCGNVQNVAAVNDMLTVVEASAPEAQYYTVVKGDNLSKVSKQFYGTPNKYMAIFEANQPMLSHPDKIYPGQLLRIPAQS